MSGVLVICGTNILLPTILQSFQQSILSASGQVDVLITHKSGDAFAPRLLNRIESIPGVAAVAGSLDRPVNIPANFYRQGNVSALALIGIDPKAAQQIRDYRIQSGRFL